MPNVFWENVQQRLEFNRVTPAIVISRLGVAARASDVSTSFFIPPPPQPPPLYHLKYNYRNYEFFGT